MKLKNKITLLTSVWVICILLFVDFTVYLLFIRIATENEKESLLTKSAQIIEKIGQNALIQNTKIDELKLLLPGDTSIRIINAQSTVISLIHVEEGFDLPPPKQVTEKESELTEGNESNVIVARVPKFEPGIKL